MSDLLGEALAHTYVEADRQRIRWPASFKQQLSLLAAARNWQTLTNPTDELIDLVAQALFRAGAPMDDGTRYPRQWARAVVDALTDTEDNDE